eukprot:scaffold122_cov236-Pinguiococcus_pyrenoidosus.AAC.2
MEAEEAYSSRRDDTCTACAVRPGRPGMRAQPEENPQPSAFIWWDSCPFQYYACRKGTGTQQARPSILALFPCSHLTRFDWSNLYAHLKLDVDAGRAEHRHLELHLDGRPRPGLLAGARHEFYRRREQRLRLAGELLDAPHDGALLRLEARAPSADVDVGAGRVGGDGDLKNDVGGVELGLEHRDDLEVDVDAGAALLLDGRDDLDGQVDVVGDAVAHQLELAIRRDEGDGAIRVKLSEAHAAVEGAVVDLHDLRAAAAGVGPGIAVHGELVVERKLALRHAAELRLHHDLARHVVAQDLPAGAHEQVDRLEDVDVHLVLAVADVRLAPVDGSRDLRGELRRVLVLQVHAQLAQVDVQAEHVDAAVLRVPEVHGLVHELVDEREVVHDLVLIEVVAQVRLEDVDLLEEILEHQRRVDVAAGHGHEVQVGVARVQEAGGLHERHGRRRAGLLAADDLLKERLRLGARDIVAVEAPDDDLPLAVDEEDSADHRWSQSERSESAPQLRKGAAFSLRTGSSVP